MKSGIIVTFLALVAMAAARTRECSIADVLFIMDESSSIWPTPFKQQKQFIKDLIDMFEIGEDLTRVGLVRFSSQAQMEFPMKAYFTKDALFGAVDRIDQRGGNTNTGDALRVAREQGLTKASGARPGDPTIPQLAIVITDGNSQETEKTKKQALLTKRTGVTVIAIGIGDVSRVELENIASGDQYIFAVNNYDALNTIKDKLGKQACNIVPTIPPENILSACRDKKLDLAIVLDKSSGVNEQNFDEMKALAQALVYSFPVDEDHTHMSVLSYSSSSKIHNNLNKGTERNGLYDTITDLKLSPATSNTAGAFKSLRSVFNPRYGARTKVAKAVLFITNTKTHDDDVTKKEAENLYSKYGVEVFAVAVGSKVSEAAWQKIAGTDHVARVESYKELNSETLRNSLAAKICAILPPPQDFACGERNPADIAFALDTVNAGKNGLSAINSFIKEVSGKFEIGPKKIQVSVLENKCHQLNGFDLNTHVTKPAVIDALKLSIHSNTANVLNELVTETFTPAKGARATGAKRFAILFVDGTPGSQKEAESAAKVAKSQGQIEIFVIGIGDKVDRRALEGIASSPKHVMMVKNYAELEGNTSLSGRLSDAICKRESLDSDNLKNCVR